MGVFDLKRSLIALLTCSVLATACSKVAPQQGSGEVNNWTKPHVLRFANAEDVSTLNPMFSQEQTVGYLSSMTAAFLIKWNHKNLPYPEVAAEVPTKANGGVSKDGLTITYHLRKGLRWSDGKPLTAGDVIWTYHAIMNPANNVTSRTGWDLISSADEPNKTTVVFHLRKPYSPFIVTFFSSAGGNPSILPEHLLAKYPNINHVPFNALPVGAGPFEYKEWVRSQRIVLVPNPYYFRGQPRLKEVDFEIIPSRDTIFTQLAAKELDLWAHVGGAYTARIGNLPGYAVLRQVAYQWGHIDFNLSHPVVADPVVRHALELATDRKTLLDKFARGAGYLQEGIAPRTAPYYDPSIPLVPFDIVQANKLLEADGWVRGPGGVREKNGLKLDLTFVLPIGTQNVDDELELIRSDWQKIGVAINLKKYPIPLLFAPYADGGILYTGKFDAILFNWIDDPIGDFSFLYGCDAIPPSGQNDLHWCNPTANAAVHEVWLDYDQAQRNAADRVLFEQLAKDRPQITLLGVQEAYIYNKDLKGFDPNGVSPFDSIMNVDI
jgi:peptide/nickel transport system substrate-binding protein